MRELEGSAAHEDEGKINQVALDYVQDAVSTGDSTRIRLLNYVMSLASCFFKVHYFSYRPLINEDSVAQVCSPSHHLSSTRTTHNSDATILLKVSIVGDSGTGKTSFMAKYICPESTSNPEFVETVGVSTEEKVVHVKSGIHIAFNIWDLGGHWQCGSMIPLVCRDAAVILIMFDLTRRSTLNSVMNWFAQAREYNKAAMTVMVGTKYDHFVELPYNIQLAIIQQARVHARAMGAPLFFSSVTHNINVHKVFKVIVAKLFDLPCSVPINLNFGEPLVDY
ncbi:hypothetical protein KP509_19G076000 [Ceratopteris richardii]|uniref:Uncharacterized protein n=1 Tax=Ceratopteris richardii TaxID=49495 RepID=A0A8T2SLT5_CERRI|nr:hypothetical protein KP509_19G076000 [Ceratopteris richardii]